MISCMSLERPGRWRAIGVSTLFSVAVLPVVPLLWYTATSTGPIASSVGAAFGTALQNSALVALFVVAVSFVVGLLAGVSIALYEFPGRGTLTALVVLPLLVPTFLWAIGWSSLTARLGLTQIMSGFVGCILVFSAGAVPFVLLASYAAALSLSGSQVDAARLAGGERTVLVQVSRHVSVPAFLAAGLGGVLTLSDPGPGQIFGWRTASAEILTSFSALYDFVLAGRQCVALTAMVLVLAVPLAWFAAPRLASEMLARQSGTLRRVRGRWTAGVAAAVLTTLVLAGTILPAVGLILPLVGGGSPGMWGNVVRTVARTAGNTLIYATGAGASAAALGLLLALSAGRSTRLRTVCLGTAIALFSLPPAFAALGLVRIAAEAPVWADPILRSRLTVGAALALRFLPVAVLLGLRAWGSTSSSWVLAAGIHGVPLGMYLRKVALPLLLPAGAVAVLLVGLLATADISTVLLLHPPGEPSLPLAIFTVMANAPESLVAALCLVYVAAAGGVLMAAWRMTGRGQA